MNKIRNIGLQALNDCVEGTGGVVLSGLKERKAVYAPLLSGDSKNFFEKRLNEKVVAEVDTLFTDVLKRLD